jgi:hypothetical protein
MAKRRGSSRQADGNGSTRHTSWRRCGRSTASTSARCPIQQQRGAGSSCHVTCCPPDAGMHVERGGPAHHGRRRSDAHDQERRNAHGRGSAGSDTSSIVLVPGSLIPSSSSFLMSSPKICDVSIHLLCSSMHGAQDRTLPHLGRGCELLLDHIATGSASDSVCICAPARPYGSPSHAPPARGLEDQGQGGEMASLLPRDAVKPHVA